MSMPSLVRRPMWPILFVAVALGCGAPGVRAEAAGDAPPAGAAMTAPTTAPAASVSPVAAGEAVARPNSAPVSAGSLAPEPFLLSARRLGAYQATVLLHSNRVEAGEPLWIRLVVECVEPPIKPDKSKIRWDLSGDLEAYVFYPNTRPLRLPGSPQNIIPSTTMEPQYRETRVFDLPVLYVPEVSSGLIFERAGTYGFSLGADIKSDVNAARLQSGVAAVTVVAASGANAMALSVVDQWLDKDMDLARRAIRDMSLMTATVETRPVLQDLVRNAPGSSLGHLAAFSLLREAFRNSDYSQAIQIASFMRKQLPRGPLTDDALLMSALSYLELDEIPAAKQVAALLYLAYPNTNAHMFQGALFTDLIEPVLRPAVREHWMLYASSTAPTQKEWKENQDRLIERMKQERRAQEMAESARKPPDEIGPPAPEDASRPVPRTATSLPGGLLDTP